MQGGIPHHMLPALRRAAQRFSATASNREVAEWHLVQEKEDDAAKYVLEHGLDAIRRRMWVDGSEMLPARTEQPFYATTTIE